MSAAVTLTLDTTPPRVTLGARLGVAAGMAPTFGYSVDEPAIADAEFVDAGGNVLPLEVMPDQLVAHDPIVAAGPYHVVIHTVDDVLNTGTQTFPGQVGSLGSIVHWIVTHTYRSQAQLTAWDYTTAVAWMYRLAEWADSRAVRFAAGARARFTATARGHWRNIQQHWRR